MTASATPGTGAKPDPSEPADHRMHPVVVIVMIIAVLAAAVGVAAYVTHGFKLRTKVAYQVPAVFELRQGDCFNGQNDIGVTPRACSSLHQAEVFATFLAIGPSTWPGDMALQAQAESGCSSRLAGYMKPDLALDQEYIYPDAVAWRAGVRTIVCDVRSQDGPIAGSVRQAASS